MRVVVHVRLPRMLLLHVLVRDVHVVQTGVVVPMAVGGHQVRPVLALRQVVRDVEVLVIVLLRVVLVMLRLHRHGSSLLRASAPGSIVRAMRALPVWSRFSASS